MNTASCKHWRSVLDQHLADLTMYTYPELFQLADNALSLTELGGDNDDQPELAVLQFLVEDIRPHAELTTWAGLGCGPSRGLPPTRSHSTQLGELLLRSGTFIKEAQAVHEFLTANPGRLFVTDEQVSLNNSATEVETVADLIATAETSTFCIRLHLCLEPEKGGYSLGRRLMRAVINRQYDMGDWPNQWSSSGEVGGPQGVQAHARMLNALADYMVLTGDDFEENYRYGIRWLFQQDEEGVIPLWSQEDCAGAISAFARSLHFWTREAFNPDMMFASEIKERMERVQLRITPSSLFHLGAELSVLRYPLWPAAAKD